MLIENAYSQKRGPARIPTRAELHAEVHPKHRAGHDGRIDVSAATTYGGRRAHPC